MTDARQLEREALASIAATSKISLEELASLPAYTGQKPNTDCVYDGSLIELSHFPPVLAKSGGELIVGILGPFWDRVFRIHFSGVNAVSLAGFGSSISMDISDIVLEPTQYDEKWCTIQGLFFNSTITVTYTSAFVLRQVLQSPVQRN